MLIVLFMITLWKVVGVKSSRMCRTLFCCFFRSSLEFEQREGIRIDNKVVALPLTCLEIDRAL